MKLSFHGAAQTVTGSKHLITLSTGKQYLLDCGMFQGLGRQADMLNRHWGFVPQDIDALILSHAHIDHSGLIPKLVKEGFSGPVYCTPATRELCGILLEDSAAIQEDEVKYVNKHRVAEGQPVLKPLYTEEDAVAAMTNFHPVDYSKWVRLDEQVELMFTDVGHIIGSAAVHLRINDKGKTTQLTFSGDVGRYRDIILPSPKEFPQADHIILESTYGNSLHDLVKTTPDLLLYWIEKTCLQQIGRAHV